MIRSALTIARLFRHEWPVLALGLIEITTVFALLGWWTLTHTGA